MTPAPDPAEGEQAERQEIALQLLDVFPELREDVLDLENAYWIAGSVAVHARDLIRTGAGSEDLRLQKLFGILNEVAARPSVNARELVAWGVMEVLQDFRETVPVAAALLDTSGMALWVEVESFWHGASPGR